MTTSQTAAAPTAATNSQPAVQPTSEVKQAEVLTQAAATVAPEAQTPAQPAAAPNSQAAQSKAETIGKAALFEIEETLKGLDPNEVLQFQRELSAERGQNLFDGEVGEIFKKYKPKATERTDKVKSLAALLKQPEKQSHAQPAQPTVKGNKPDLNNELLKTKVELELVRNGVPDEFMSEATIVAMTKVKSLAELSKAAEVASKFSVFKTNGASNVPSRTSVGIGENKREMTEGEKAVAYLKSRNPNGWKK